MRLKITAIVVLLVVAGGAVLAATGALNPSPTATTNLLTSQAAVSDVTDEIAATGSVAAVSKYALAFGQAPTTTDGAATGDGFQADQLAASVTWPVLSVAVKAGDRVTKGQALAVADRSDLESQITEATRTAKSAALQLKQATTDRADATTTAAKRQTQQSLYNAQTAAERATSDLAALEALRDRLTLTAPADGTVTSVTLTAGAHAPSGAAITLISADLVVSTSVVESDIASIKLGQEATIAVAALDASLRGSVSAIDPVGTGSASGGVVSFAVSVALDAPPAGLRPGMSVDITIVAASATRVLAIPSRALAGSAGSYTVQVVAADGSVSTRAVEVGLVTSSLAEIRSGLQAGELVVTGTSSTQSSVTNAAGGPPFGGGGTIIRGVGR